MLNNTSYLLNQFTINLPTLVIITREISDGAKITLAYLLSFSDRDEIRISQAKVAENLSKSATTINKHYLQLEKNGYIKILRKTFTKEGYAGFISKHDVISGQISE